MGQRPIGIGTVEGIAIEAVRAIADERGVTRRTLILGAGISESRGYRILDGHQAATVTDFVNLCDYLHLVAWQVLRDAENGTAAGRHLSPVPDLPPTEVYGTPPAYDPELMAAQGEGTDIDAEQEGSQDLP